MRQPVWRAATRASLDLFGEGLPGILTEVDRTWHYKQNIGGGAYSTETTLIERPSVRDGSGSLGDYDSDGNTDLAELSGRFAGRFTDRSRNSAMARLLAVRFVPPHVEALGGRAR